MIVHYLILVRWVPCGVFFSPGENNHPIKKRRLQVRFDPGVQFLLRTIWRASDLNGSGAIDRDECVGTASHCTRA